MSTWEGRDMLGMAGFRPAAAGVGATVSVGAIVCALGFAGCSSLPRQAPERTSSAEAAARSSGQTLPLAAEPDAAERARIAEAYGKLPLAFEENRGQSDPEVRFLTRGNGYALFLTAREAVLSLRRAEPERTRPEPGAPPALPAASADHFPADPGAVIRMRLSGSANSFPQLSGVEELSGRSNYLIGNDPSQRQTAVPNFSRVRYESVYAGIDLVYYGSNQRQLEYDFVIAPGADPGSIRVRFEGTEAIELAENGDLVLRTAQGEVIQHSPVVYQPRADGTRESIEGGYALTPGGEVGFRVAAYDQTKPLVIDPVLAYATLLGGSGHDCGGNCGIAVDSAGNAYVAGGTTSANFPTTANTLQPAYGGGFQDAFVAKINAAGSALVYSTYLGGGSKDVATGIAVDSAGNAYVTGATGSSDFPTTPNALQPTFGGNTDAFVAKLNSAGSALVYSTYLGGSGGDAILGIAVDDADNAYVAGLTDSFNFPTTANALQPTKDGCSDAFVAKINAAGSALVYSTYLGGGSVDVANAIALDAAGNAYVAGRTSIYHFNCYGGSFPTTPNALQPTRRGVEDAFVTKLNAAGSALVYSTYLGGGVRYEFESATGIAVDSAGNAYVTGTTPSSDFPTTANAFQPTLSGSGAYDAFVTKLNATGSTLVYSTYLGGANSNGMLSVANSNGIAIDSAGNAYVVGSTNSPAFPTTANALPRPPPTVGRETVFVTKLNATGSALVYSTFLGNRYGYNIAVDSAGNAYVIGAADAVADFPTTVNALQPTFGGGYYDAFVAKLSEPTLDTDGDGILDDGDRSLTAGDHPCTGGNTDNCDDNCRTVSNAKQEDCDGDGRGDDCEGDDGSIVFHVFPLRSLGVSAYSAKISSVLDHAGDFLSKGKDPFIVAYTGETGIKCYPGPECAECRGICAAGPEDPTTDYCEKSQVCSYQKQAKDHKFVVNNHYDGGLYLAYDGHDGYDYGFPQHLSNWPANAVIEAPLDGNLCKVSRHTDPLIIDGYWTANHTFYIDHGKFGQKGYATWYIHARELFDGGVCRGGSNAGYTCRLDSECGVDGVCGRVCRGGSNAGNTCRVDSECPGVGSVCGPLSKLKDGECAKVKEGQAVAFVGGWGPNPKDPNKYINTALDKHLHMVVRSYVPCENEERRCTDKHKGPEGTDSKIIDPYGWVPETPDRIGANTKACVQKEALWPRCGNERLDAPEGCDDGNLVSGDGCSETCIVEPDWACIGEPSVCTLTKVVGPRGTVSTGTTSGETAPADELRAAVTTPAGGAVSITTSPNTGASPTSFRLLGHHVDIAAPPGTVDDPLVIVFTIDKLMAGGSVSKNVAVFKNANSNPAAISKCTDPTRAVPDPCVAARESLVGDDVRITVRTTSASEWSFGVVGCTAVPRVACHKPTQGLTAVLAVTNKDRVTSDSLAWNWTKGEATPASDFGDPLDTDDYSLCMYDESVSAPDLIFEAMVHAGAKYAVRGVSKPCWTGKGTPPGNKGYKYKNKDRTPDGIEQLALKPGAAGAAAVTVKAKGEFLSNRTLELPALPLNLPLRVQLQAGNGQCWEAAYSTASKNKAGVFKAKSD